jgi:CBS domain-containing protein
MFLKEIMQKRIVTLSPEATVREAAKKMKDYRVGYLLVTNGESLKGCVTDRDLVLWLAGGKNPDEVRVESIMQSNVVTAEPETDVYEASKIMARKKIRRLPIVEDGRLCGLVSISDIASILEEEVDNFFHVEEAHQM